MGNRRVEVEEQGKVNRLIRIEELIFKAEALDLVEVHRCVLRKDLVDCNASYRFVRSIVYFVEGKCSFTCVDN